MCTNEHYPKINRSRLSGWPAAVLYTWRIYRRVTRVIQPSIIDYHLISTHKVHIRFRWIRVPVYRDEVTDNKLPTSL
jgi:hypothetical protein